jgi:WD40 repeat protein
MSDVIFEILDSPICLPTFSPDGSRFAAVVARGVIHVWDTITHNLLRISQKYSANIRSLVLSPDGTRIILICSYSSEMTVQIWLITEDLTITLNGDWHSSTSAAFFPDGMRFLTTTEENISIWDMPSTTPVLVSTLTSDWLGDYASISSDGARLILHDGLWDLVNGRRITSYTGGTSTAEFSPDCKLVALGGYDGVHILDATTGARLYKSHLFSLRQLSFSLDSTRLLAVCDDGHAQVLDLTSLPTSVGAESLSCVYPPDCMMIQLQWQHLDGWYMINGTRLIWLPHNMRPTWLTQGKQPFGSRRLFLGSGNDVTVLDVDDYLEVLPASVAWREAGVRYLEDALPFHDLMSGSGNKV